jgi:hypothetical protein
MGHGSSSSELQKQISEWQLYKACSLCTWQSKSEGQICPPSKVSQMVLPRCCRMTKAIKQAHNYLLILHFDKRSHRNSKNPHSRGCLLTLYKTYCCCQSFQSPSISYWMIMSKEEHITMKNSVNEDVCTGIELSIVNSLYKLWIISYPLIVSYKMSLDMMGRPFYLELKSCKTHCS